MGYRLNRQLILEAPERLGDGAGGYVKSWTALGTLWGQVTAGAGREVAGATAPLSRVPYKIVVRAVPVGTDARPKADQRFREGTRVFRILSVAEDDRNGRYLMCSAQEETVA